MTKQPSLKQLQHAFASAVRNPKVKVAIPNVNEKRLSIYQGLVFNNISSLISNSFPVTYEILTSQQWNKLMYGFLQGYHTNNPLFHELPLEFINYVQTLKSIQPVFLLELLHYEWIELALEINNQQVIFKNDVNDLLNTQLSISPLACLLQYQYPVHKVCADFIPDQIEETYLVVYRNQQDEVKFLEINIITAKLIQLLATHPDITGKQALTIIAEELKSKQSNEFITLGKATLTKLYKLGIIIEHN